MDTGIKIRLISVIIITTLVMWLCSTIEHKSANYNFNGTILGEGKNIEINQPQNFNNKTKNEIYEIRQNFVAKSIFADKDYKPSDDIFGQIVDYKPWISTDICSDNNSDTSPTDGPAEESRFINNPSMLVGINFLFSFPKCNDNQKATYKHFLPREIKYYEEENIIKVMYNYLPYNYGNTFYSFEGTNARDFGYKYAYVDLSRTNINLRMDSEQNITNNVSEFLNFIHLGGSCGVEGGCNNGSPHQPELNFNYFIRPQVENPEIYIKLWKEKPENVDQEPDIVEIISIDKEF